MSDAAARFRVVALETVDSTNEEARRCADAGAPDCTVIWSQRQEKGRGRQGRTWDSPSGNLYCSVLLRPGCSPAAASQLAFVAAVAVADAVSAVLPQDRRVTCKWPNDVLVDGRKVSGILVESAASAADHVDWVIIGQGINIAHHPDPGQEAYPSTSISADGADDIGPERMLEHLLASLAEGLTRWTAGGFAPVRERWLERAHGLGQPLTARFGETQVVGVFRSLDADGALILDVEGGSHRIVAGDVFPAMTSN